MKKIISNKTLVFNLLLFLCFISSILCWMNFHSYPKYNTLNVIIETHLDNHDDILLKNGKEYYLFKSFNNTLNQTIKTKTKSLELLISEKHKNKIKSVVLYNDTKINYFKDFSNFEKSQEKFCNKNNCTTYNKYKFSKEINYNKNSNIINFHSKTKIISSFFDTFFSFNIYFYPIYIFVLIAFIYYKKYEKEIKLSKKTFVIPSLIFLLAIFLRLDDITTYTPWGDECYSILISNPSLPFLNIFNDPGNPPFYYFILRLYMLLFKESYVGFRIISVLFSIGGGVFLYLFLRKNYCQKSANIAIFLYAINSSLIYFSQEIRCYCLQTFISILIFIYIFKIIKKCNLKNLIIFGILTSLAINTHYYQILFAISNFIFLNWHFIKEKEYYNLKKIIIVYFVSFLSFLPFYLITGHNKALLDTSFNTYLPEISYNLVKTCVYYIFGGALSFIFSIIFFINTFKNKNYTSKEKEIIIYCLWTIFCTISLGIILSLVIRPMFVQRYLAFLVPFFLVYLSIIFSHNYKRKLIYFLFVIWVFQIQSHTQNFFLNMRKKYASTYNTFEIAKKYSNHTKKKITIIARVSDKGSIKLLDLGKFNIETIPKYNSYDILEEKIQKIKNKDKNAIIFTSLLETNKKNSENKNYTCYFNSSQDLCIWKIE